MTQDQASRFDIRGDDHLPRGLSIFRKAPLLLPVILWSVGIVLSRIAGASVPALVWPVALVACAVCGLFWRSSRMPLLLLCCLLAGGTRWVAVNPASRPLDSILAQRHRVRQQTEFRVTDLLSTTSGAYGIRVQSIAGKGVRERVLLFCKEELQVGASYRALLEILPLTDDPVLDIYPTRYHARAYLLMGLQKTGDGLGKWHPDAIRSALLKRLDAHAGEASAAAKALLLSDTSAKREYRDRLQRGGMMHLIVVSGLHVWFIYAILIVLLRSLLPRKLADVVFLLLICVFAALNHWAAPIARAVLMITLLTLAKWRGCPVNPAQVIALCLLIITAVAPDQLFSVGLQLSFLCVAVILFAVPKVRFHTRKDTPRGTLKPLLERLFEYLALTLLVSIAILPLTLYYFGQGSLNGILGNALGIPITGLLLPASFLVLIFPPGTALGSAFLATYKLLLWLFEAWMDFSGSMPFFFSGLHISLPQSIGLALLILPLLLRTKRGSPWRWAKICVPGVLGCLLLFGSPLLKPRRGEILIFNAGTADCALIRLPSGENILIDTGPGISAWEAEKDPTSVLETNVWASKRLLPWLKRNGIQRLDQIVLTHTHADHIGGFAALGTNLKIGNLIATDEFLASDVWKLLKAQNWMRDVKVTPLTHITEIRSGDASFHFLHPDSLFSTDSENDRSIVLRMDFRGKRYLFAADIEAPAEDYLVQTRPDELDADFLKAPHHGSRSSNGADFLAAVSPDEVWICCSARNVYGFPHPEAMEVFRRHARRVRFTYEGTIRVPL
jgi:competence protein ComEC